VKGHLSVGNEQLGIGAVLKDSCEFNQLTEFNKFGAYNNHLHIINSSKYTSPKNIRFLGMGQG
ncbi:MAG: hypothetical protein PUD43_00120, partial [Clostridia bacterium]|nr:hypothetical protein [Clostridia bacterium]